MIQIKELSKSFFIQNKKISVIKNLNLNIQKDKITTILGRSGCGKTTLLRLIANLEKYDNGEILLPKNIKVGFVFQEPRLMPFLNVYENIVFSLNKNQINLKKINDIINLIGLNDFKFAYPSQLSGGMSSRVSMARAISYEANFILMDEPFAALDNFTRNSMQELLLNLQDKEQKTILFVTHNIDEALYISDEIILLENGCIKSKFNLIDIPKKRDLLDIKMINLKKEILKQL